MIIQSGQKTLQIVKTVNEYTELLKNYILFAQEDGFRFVKKKKEAWYT